MRCRPQGTAFLLVQARLGAGSGSAWKWRWNPESMREATRFGSNNTAHELSQFTLHVRKGATSGLWMGWAGGLARGSNRDA